MTETIYILGQYGLLYLVSYNGTPIKYVYGEMVYDK